MQSVDTQTFLECPYGRYVAGHSYIFWCARPELFGLILHGRPSAEEMTHLARLFEVELGAEIPPHAKLLDCHRLGSVELHAYEALAAWVHRASQVKTDRITRIALVNAVGLAGAVTAGFFSMNQPIYPVQMFEDEVEALSWLEGHDARELADELERIYTLVTSQDPTILEVRTAIEARLDDPTLAAVAAALARSERTLQRQLKKLETTFQAEVVTVRLALARQRMVDSDAPLTHIALDVGFSSLQHFSASFSRAFGVQPSAWRAENAERFKAPDAPPE